MQFPRHFTWRRWAEAVDLVKLTGLSEGVFLGMDMQLRTTTSANGMGTVSDVVTLISGIGLDVGFNIGMDMGRG